MRIFDAQAPGGSDPARLSGCKGFGQGVCVRREPGATGCVDVVTVVGRYAVTALMRGLLKAAKAVATGSLTGSFLAAPVLAFDLTLNAPGAAKDLDFALRSASSTVAAFALNRSTSQEILAATRADYRSLLQVLYDAGHFGASISIRVDGREAGEITPLAIPERIQKVDILVDLGPKFRFGQARITPLAPDTTLPDGFVTGAPASTSALRDATRAAREGWRQAGHPKVAVDGQRIVADHTRARLDAHVRLRPGPALRFGTLTVTGNQDVRTDAIRTIAGLPTGETFDPDALDRSAARLRRTGTFRSVVLKENDEIGPGDTIGITAEVSENLPRRFRFGGELASNSGLSLSMGWLHRNLTGKAERLSLQGEISNIGGDQDLEGRFSIRLDQPERLGPDDNVFLLADLERFDREHYELDRLQFGIGVERVLGENLTGSLALMASASNADDAFGNRNFRTLSLPFTLTLDRRDVAQNATRGYYVETKLTPFAGLKGTKSGMAVGVDGRAFWSLTESGSVVLASRVQLGSVLGPALSEISPEYLFFSGGAGTVRGHTFESLGIPVGTATAGGRSIFAASTEIRARINDSWGVAGFFDYALVDSEPFPGSGARRHSGAGLGVRYTAGGFGPIRLDLALPVSGPMDDGLQFYIGIGQAF